MRLLDILERKFGRYALPHLTLGLIACQVVMYVALFTMSKSSDIEPAEERFVLIPEKVMEGEVWRLASFLIVPPMSNILWAFFFWYLFYLMGSALEQLWGDFRYNCYLLIGYGATVAVSFLIPEAPASNAYVQGSVFLAFAFLFPDFEMYIFFILPVKVKWLALLTWIGYALVFLFGAWQTRLLVAASICNFLLFFARDIIERIRTGRRRMAMQAARLTAKEPAYHHRCAVCGITDRTNPRMDFRYCSQCQGSHAYCADHLRNHEHVKEGVTPPS